MLKTAKEAAFLCLEMLYETPLKFEEIVAGEYNISNNNKILFIESRASARAQAELQKTPPPNQTGGAYDDCQTDIFKSQ